MPRNKGFPSGGLIIKIDKKMTSNAFLDKYLTDAMIGNDYGVHRYYGYGDCKKLLVKKNIIEKKSIF